MKDTPLRHVAALLRVAVGRATLALGVCLALVVGSLAFAGPATQQRGPHTVYLPVVRGGQGAGTPTTPTPTTPTPTTPTPSERGARFLEPTIKHNSADLALDSAGAMHAAYVHFIPNADNPRAVYTFCTAGPSGCGSAAAASGSIKLSRLSTGPVFTMRRSHYTSAFPKQWLQMLVL
jgi:hypothetical protein